MSSYLDTLIRSQTGVIPTDTVMAEPRRRSRFETDLAGPSEPWGDVDETVDAAAAVPNSADHRPPPLVKTAEALPPLANALPDASPDPVQTPAVAALPVAALTDPSLRPNPADPAAPTTPALRQHPPPVPGDEPAGRAQTAGWPIPAGPMPDPTSANISGLAVDPLPQTPTLHARPVVSTPHQPPDPVAQPALPMAPSDPLVAVDAIHTSAALLQSGAVPDPLVIEIGSIDIHLSLPLRAELARAALPARAPAIGLQDWLARKGER